MLCYVCVCGFCVFRAACVQPLGPAKFDEEADARKGKKARERNTRAEERRRKQTKKEVPTVNIRFISVPYYFWLLWTRARVSCRVAACESKGCSRLCLNLSCVLRSRRADSLPKSVVGVKQTPCLCISC